MTMLQLSRLHGVATNNDYWNGWFPDYFSPVSNMGDLLQSGRWNPPTDIYETDKGEIVIEIELPGFKLDDLNVVVEDNVLILNGERRFENDANVKQWHCVERGHGTFSRRFSLPSTVDSNNVSARYEDGTLTIKLVIRDEAKPKRITVEAA